MEVIIKSVVKSGDGFTSLLATSLAAAALLDTSHGGASCCADHSDEAAAWSGAHADGIGL
ncbi:MAG: hypothetical protein AAGA68_06400 [Pseudomonadota bacterium]